MRGPLPVWEASCQCATQAAGPVPLVSLRCATRRRRHWRLEARTRYLKEIECHVASARGSQARASACLQRVRGHVADAFSAVPPVQAELTWAHTAAADAAAPARGTAVAAAEAKAVAQSQAQAAWGRGRGVAPTRGGGFLFPEWQR